MDRLATDGPEIPAGTEDELEDTELEAPLEDGEEGEDSTEEAAEPQGAFPSDDQPQETPRQPSRAQQRIQRLIEERKAAQEEARQYRERLDSVYNNMLERQNPPEQSQPRQMTPEEEYQYVAQLDEIQRYQYWTQKNEQATQAAVRRVELNNAIQKDTMEFNSFVGADPEFLKP